LLTPVDMLAAVVSALTPRVPALHRNRASALMKVMDYPGALSDAEKAIKVDATYVKGYYRKGLVQMAMKEYHKVRPSTRSSVCLVWFCCHCRSSWLCYLARPLPRLKRALRLHLKTPAARTVFAKCTCASSGYAPCCSRRCGGVVVCCCCCVAVF